MASVTDYIDCPHCGAKSEMVYDLNCNTGEEWTLCNRCGYHFQSRLILDANGKVMRDSDGKWFYDTIEKHGAGVVYAENKNHPGCGSVTRIPIDPEEKADFLKAIEKAQKDNPDIVYDVRKWPPASSQPSNCIKGDC